MSSTLPDTIMNESMDKINTNANAMQVAMSVHLLFPPPVNLPSVP